MNVVDIGDFMKGPGINRKVELAANIVIVLAGLFLGVRFFYPQLFSSGQRVIPETIAVGARFGLQPAQGSSQDMTLVLVLREGCHFCAESAPFYQRLARLAKDSTKLHLMAVLPQPVAQGREYLNRIGVALSDVQEGRFQTLKIGYTPTLLLLDRRGAVRKEWVGKLSRQRETEVEAESGLATSVSIITTPVSAVLQKPNRAQKD